jgi:hypothetical protein
MFGVCNEHARQWQLLRVLQSRQLQFIARKLEIT